MLCQSQCTDWRRLNHHHLNLARNQDTVYRRSDDGSLYTVSEYEPGSDDDDSDDDSLYTETIIRICLTALLIRYHTPLNHSYINNPKEFVMAGLYLVGV